jgi:hypothetical protein
MKRSLHHLLAVLPLTLPAAASQLAAAEAAAAEWCTYDTPPGETFPAPQHNLPEWVCAKASRTKLHEKYRIRTVLNPFFLTGDFNGDGKLDAAIWVENARLKQVGVLIVHGGNIPNAVIGAGIDWNKRGKDYSWTDIWSVEPKGTKLKSPHEGDRLVVARGEILVLRKSESASFAVYWSGGVYRSYQLSD